MRQFGTIINGNRSLNQELSPNARAAILYAVENKQSPSKIAEEFRINRSTVYRTVKRAQQRQDLKSRPRVGRPKKLTQYDIRYIYRIARRRPRISWRALVAESPGGASLSTIRRVLRVYHLKKWKSKKRVLLNSQTAKKRREFARKWRNYREWEMVIFSDECSVQRKSNSTDQYVFRFNFEGLRKDLVNLQSHGRDISQMVWGAIWIGGRSKLVIMDRDQDAPREGYTANSYIQALEEGLQDNYKPGQIFQQDNARIHTALRTQEWFEKHGIWVMEWPPHSPDLNPIEPVWRLLKGKLLRLYPELFMEGKSELDWERFKQALCDAWDELDQGVIDNLIRSMPRRIKAVIKAKGWYTKY